MVYQQLRMLTMLQLNCFALKQTSLDQCGYEQYNELNGSKLEQPIAVSKHVVQQRQPCDKQQQHCTYVQQMSMSLDSDADLFATGGGPSPR